MVCAWREVFKKTLAEDALTKTLPSFNKFLNDNPKFKAMGDFAASLTQFFGNYGGAEWFYIPTNSEVPAKMGSRNNAESVREIQIISKNSTVITIMQAAQKYYEAKDKEIMPYEKLGQLPDYSSKYNVKSSEKKGKKK